MKFSPLDEILRFFGICFLIVVVVLLLAGEIKDGNGKVVYKGPFAKEEVVNVDR